MIDHENGCGITPCRCASPSVIGITHFWLRNVEITGYSTRPNQYIPPGTLGDMEVIETSTEARVINARFHPGGEGNGFGLVTNPQWTWAKEEDVKAYKEAMKKVATDEPTLDEFIAPRLKELRMFPRNAYVKHPGWKSLYVRVSQRYIDGRVLRMVIDLANIEAFKPGTGAFRNLVTHLRKTYPQATIYVEQVLSQRFQEGLLRLGFTRRGDFEPSYYLLPAGQ